MKILFDHTFAIRLNSSNIGYALSSFHVIFKGLDVICLRLDWKLAVAITGTEEMGGLIFWLVLLLRICSSFDVDSIFPGVEELNFTSGGTFGQIFKSKIPRRNVLKRNSQFWYICLQILPIGIK